jgi:MFS family permease
LNLVAVPVGDTNVTAKSHAQRTLVLASLAHALHDGFTDMIYVLLPVWQAEFTLDYVALAVLRALYVGVLAALQVPSAHLARHMNARTVLVLGTVLSSIGYALAGLSGGLVGLCLSLALAVRAAAHSIHSLPLRFHELTVRGRAALSEPTTSPVTSVKQHSRPSSRCC